MQQIINIVALYDSILLLNCILFSENDKKLIGVRLN
jgi:hypothetical protein